MNKQITYRIIVMLAALLLASCSLLPKDKDETENWTAQRFYNEAHFALISGDYEVAIELYQKLEARYPFGAFAQQSQLEIAYAFYKYDEPESSIAAIDRFIKLHPRHPYADYAYYLKGLVNFNRGATVFERFVPSDPSQRDAGASLSSFQDFSALVEKYPDSRYSNDAKLRMLYLKNNLAQYEVHVAHYYQKRGAWLAAANRAKYVVKHYQRSPSVEEALVVMVKSYQQLGLAILAEDAQRVLDTNRANNNFARYEDNLKDASFGLKVWDFLELDE